MSPVRFIVRSGGQSYEVLPSAMATRPDPGWVYRDPAGHEHRWAWRGGDAPFTGHASVPSCRMTQHVPLSAGEKIPSARYECDLCAAVVEPGRVTEKLRRYLIDGVEVSRGEFEDRAIAAGIPKMLVE